MSSLPKCTIVVTAYGEKAKPMLDICIKSIFNMDYPREKLEVIIVTKPGYEPRYEGAYTVWPKKERFGCAESINYGFSWAAVDSEFLMHCNDDVIFTRDCLKNTVEMSRATGMILCPVSNCSNYAVYILRMGIVENGELIPFEKRQYGLGELEPHADKLMNAYSIYPPGVMARSHLYTYACLIPREAWQRIGPYDENFYVGFDDTDFSWRARLKGYALGICLNAQVWHFSGTTADETLNKEIRDKNMAYFQKKWGQLPDVINPPAWETKFESDFVGE